MLLSVDDDPLGSESASVTKLDLNLDIESNIMMTAQTQLATNSQGALFLPSVIKGEAKGFPKLEKALATVSLQPMYVANQAMSNMAKEVPDYIARAIVNDMTGDVLATCRNQHVPVQNQELLDAMHEAFSSCLPSAYVDNMRLEECVSRGGAFNALKLTSPDYSHKITQSNGSTTRLDFGMMMVNAHGNRAVTAYPFMLDESCGNTVMFSDWKATQQHSESFNINRFKVFIERMVNRAPKHFNMIQKWAQTPCNEDQLLCILIGNPQISAAAASSIVDYFAAEEVLHRGENLYAALSAMAAWASHNEGDFYIRNSRNSDNEAESLFARQEKIFRLISSPAFLGLAS